MVGSRGDGFPYFEGILDVVFEVPWLGAETLL